MRKKGSLTLEATLLMMILIPFFLAVITFTFYIHDRCFLQLAAGEAAVRGSVLPEENRTAAEVERIARTIAGRQLIWTYGVEWGITLSRSSVTVSASGVFRFPGYASFLFAGIDRNISVSARRAIADPAREVRLIHSIGDIIE